MANDPHLTITTKVWSLLVYMVQTAIISPFLSKCTILYLIDYEYLDFILFSYTMLVCFSDSFSLQVSITSATNKLTIKPSASCNQPVLCFAARKIAMACVAAVLLRDTQCTSNEIL